MCTWKARTTSGNEDLKRWMMEPVCLKISPDSLHLYTGSKTTTKSCEVIQNDNTLQLRKELFTVWKQIDQNIFVVHLIKLRLPYNHAIWFLLTCYLFGWAVNIFRFTVSLENWQSFNLSHFLLQFKYNDQNWHMVVWSIALFIEKLLLHLAWAKCYMQPPKGYHFLPFYRNFFF